MIGYVSYQIQKKLRMKFILFANVTCIMISEKLCIAQLNIKILSCLTCYSPIGASVLNYTHPCLMFITFPTHTFLDTCYIFIWLAWSTLLICFVHVTCILVCDLWPNVKLYICCQLWTVIRSKISLKKTPYGIPSCTQLLEMRILRACWAVPYLGMDV